MLRRCSLATSAVVQILCPAFNDFQCWLQGRHHLPSPIAFRFGWPWVSTCIYETFLWSAHHLHIGKPNDWLICKTFGSIESLRASLNGTNQNGILAFAPRWCRHREPTPVKLAISVYRDSPIETAMVIRRMKNFALIGAASHFGRKVDAVCRAGWFQMQNTVQTLR